MSAVQIGRLALRQEGDLWVAYYATTDTMDGALYLGSIRIAFVQTDERRSQFIALMREAVADLIEQRIGERPLWPDGERPAPDSERGERVPNPYLR